AVARPDGFRPQELPSALASLRPPQRWSSFVTNQARSLREMSQRRMNGAKCFSALARPLSSNEERMLPGKATTLHRMPAKYFTGSNEAEDMSCILQPVTSP